MKKLKQEIKRCAYWLCDKRPKIRKFKSGAFLYSYEVSCSGCGHSFTEFGKTKAEAIKKWNKRMSR